MRTEASHGRPPETEGGAGKTVGWALWILPLFVGFWIRVGFVASFPTYVGDSYQYDPLARNLVDHAAYSMDAEAPYRPTTLRPPVYAVYLAAFYAVEQWVKRDSIRGGPAPARIEGAASPPADPYLTWARWGQIFVDLGTCSLMALTLGALFPGGRGWLWALWALCLCPFTAVYCGAILTETLTTFFWVLTLFSMARYSRCQKRRWLLVAGAASAMAGLTHLDSLLLVVLPIGVVLLENGKSLRRSLQTLPILVVPALILIAPWLARNERVSGNILGTCWVPATFFPRGYLNWVQTWLWEPSLVQPLVQEPIWRNPLLLDPRLFPPAAFDSPTGQAKVLALVTSLRVDGKWTEAVDTSFAELARERVHRHPFRQWIVVPLQRIFGMWTTSRTELFPLPAWKDSHTPRLIFWKLAAFNLNLTYLLIGGLAWLWLPRDWTARCLLWGPVAYRSALSLPVLVFPVLEPRYTMQAFPILVGFFGFGLWQVWGGRGRPRQRALIAMGGQGQTRRRNEPKE